MYQNPYAAYLGSQTAMNPYQGMPVSAPQMQVTRVNGENGANTYAIGPNSSALLLDTSGTMIWAVTTDGAGYKTVVPYDIIPHKTQEEKTFMTLESRIKRLEELINDRHHEADLRSKSEDEPD